MLELSLIEWPTDGSGPRLLGRTTDLDLIETARTLIAAGRRRELAKIEGPVRALGSRRKPRRGTEGQE